tara:strand:- start:42 stop:1073 length:1032 start_codon:yes stop_codon:yes gene_type:complete
MAISTTSYSPKEFMFLIAEQDRFGTLEGASDNAYHAVDVDSISTPSLNPTQALDVRTGSRVLQAKDFFQDVIGSVKEISVSGTATTAVLDLLLENIMEESVGDASGIYTVTSQSNTTSIGTGDSGGDVAGKILSIVIKSGKSDSDLSFRDCVCTSLTLNGDVGTEGGRIKFSATFQSGSTVVDLSDDTTAVDTHFESQHNYFMSSWVAGYRQIDGIADLVLNSFSCTVENPASFQGLASTGYEVISRAGEISATLDATVKYDATSEPFFANFNAQTNNASTAAAATILNHQAALANGAFGISMPLTFLTNVALNEGDVMMLDLSVKAVGSGISSATALVEIAC